jgi:hypothetical protein
MENTPEITAQLLQQKAAQLKLSCFTTHECEECGFKIRYIFGRNEVTYNNACRCENGGGLTVSSSWKSVAEDVKGLLAIPSKKDVVAEYWKLYGNPNK